MAKTISISGKTRRFTRVRQSLKQGVTRAFRPVMLLSAVVAILAAVALTWLRPFGLDLELWSQDWRQAARFDTGSSAIRLPGQVQPTSDANADPWQAFDVCIVTEDEASIRALDGLPVTPAQEATLIDVLSHLGVDVIAFDRLFSERRTKIFPFGPGTDNVGSVWLDVPIGSEETKWWLLFDSYRRRVELWEGPERASSRLIDSGDMTPYEVPEDLRSDDTEGKDWYMLSLRHYSRWIVGFGKEFELGVPVELEFGNQVPLTSCWPMAPTGLLGQIRDAQEHRECRVIYGWKFEFAGDGEDSGGTLAMDVAEQGREKIAYWPLPEIEANAGKGCLNLFVRDRVARGYPYLHALGDDHTEPSLALACAQAVAALRGESLNDEGVQLLNTRLPSTGADLRPLNFYGPPGTIPTVPWATLTELWTAPLPVPAEVDRDNLAEILDLLAEEEEIFHGVTPETLSRQYLSAMQLQLTSLQAEPDVAELYAEEIAGMETALTAYGPALADLDVWRERLQGKTAMVGSWTLESQDIYDVPITSDPMYGVEIHATALQNLWDAQNASLPMTSRVGLTEVSRGGEILWVIVLAAIMALLGMSLPYFLSAGAGLVLGFIYVQFALGQFLDMTTFYPLAYPLIGMAVTWLIVSGARFFTLDRERRQIDSMFKNYVDRRFVEILKKDPSKISLGGERRGITIFFSDVAGFSGIAERLEPEELVTLLNEYLGAMTDIILKWDGTIDKYIGDAVMAFWNAPIEIDDHAVKACYAALEQRELLQDLQRNWQERGFPLVTSRMGLNTGNTVHANVGSRLRMNYTLMGDPVNLAARFEPLNKDFSTDIIIGEHTRQSAEGHILTRRLGRVQIKGRQQPVAFYELLGRKRDTTPAQAELIERFDAALTWFDRADFERAASAWLAILKRFPTDGPSRTYLALAKRYLQRPPSGDKPWDGVFVQTHK